MREGVTRRTALAASGLFWLGGMAPANLKAVEKQAGGRLGFALLDSGNGKVIGHREDERFALCSTFKLPLAALTLKGLESGEFSAKERIAIRKADMVPHAPVTGLHVGKSMGLRELAEATQITSDNVAANLLLKKLGGPEAFTRRLRELGDEVTRLDRWEPEMNRVIGDDPRDTSTPLALAKTVEKLVLGNMLKPASRNLLVTWMANTRTGMGRLRAGVPAGWKVGDKTGTASAPGMPNRTNDVAVIWPPDGAPLVAAAFYEAPGHFPGGWPQDEAVLRDAMIIALQSMGLGH
ncbi:class A beta-lactamase [Sandaracinobacter sp. RS1-74]|uniref:class A beta-lactamase n=1 Tax=Sandaracinobacteroides sayramensis TaxID=2913411 RepID=UPI001EDB862B|nr:class A beta-lactamase [Sandaracinobacteroides sayramensis]MCG2840089.1 class A beta-lactamase [Sandaracinobacteroides sayramensis]